MNINLVNQSKVIKDSDAVIIGVALNAFSSQVCTAWNIPAHPVTYGSGISPAVWNLCIVDKFPNPAMTAVALGYHEVSNGLPIGYIKATPYGSSRAPLGRYMKPITALGKTIMPAKYLRGLVTVMAHELAEMLIDPNIDQWKTDGQGRNWLMEVCDHTTGEYANPLPAYGTNAVLPDFTLPSFYDVAAKAPYSHLNVPVMPFHLVPGAYAYYKDATGTHKV